MVIKHNTYYSHWTIVTRLRYMAERTEWELGGTTDVVVVTGVIYMKLVRRSLGNVGLLRRQLFDDIRSRYHNLHNVKYRGSTSTW